MHRLEEPRAGISDKKEGGAEDKGGGGDVWIEGKGSMGIRLGRDRGRRIVRPPPRSKRPIVCIFYFPDFEKLQIVPVLLKYLQAGQQSPPCRKSTAMEPAAKA